MGVEVVDERPYEFAAAGAAVLDLRLRAAPQAPPRGRPRPCPATSLQQVAGSSRTRSPRCGTAEPRTTASTRWCSTAGLTWRQVVVLRAYAKYLRQTGHARSARTTSSESCGRNPAIARLLVAAVRGAVRPGAAGGRRPSASEALRRGDRRRRSTRWPASTRTASCAPSSALIRATLRTNYFQRRRRRRARSRTWSFKLDPARVPDLPAPRPMFEICASTRPRVRGRAPARSARSRAAACAGRTGARTSAPRCSGLVKAQMVKNAVIVPVGAKGGFVLQAAARPGATARRAMARGHRLLPDVHPRPARRHRQPASAARSCRRRDVVRHDGDDPYLVVAADKGTATFSDIANAIAAELRLLARRRVRLGRLGRLRPQGDGHHRARRLGVGQAPLPRAGRRHADAGLHRRRHRRHVAATCSATACCCRSTSGWSRRSTTGTSSSTRTRTPAASLRRARAAVRRCRARRWADYDATLISRGRRRLPARGEVDPGHARRCATALGIDDGVDDADAGRADPRDPAGAGRPALERRHRHLRQGRATRSHADVGDRANDARPRRRRRAARQGRRRGRQPRAARSAAASSTRWPAARINTDAIDNSAGVDTSDHEVNIKILLDGVVAATAS